MVQIRYGPDDETLQGVIRPPQNDQENPDNTEEDFQSAESSSSQTSSDDDTDDDTNETDPKNAINETDPDPSGDNTPEPSPPPREGPSDEQGQDLNAHTADGDPATDAADPNIGGNLSRGARSRAPVRRQRSLSHPLSKKQTWKLKLAEQIQEHRRMCEARAQGRRCDTCRQAEEAQQQDRETAQPEGEQEPDHAIAQHQEEAPPEQGENPQNKTRSGRVSRRPDHLSYNKDFNQHGSEKILPVPGTQGPERRDYKGPTTDV